ncbi:MAG: flagellar basal body rod protein FlgB [Burkholderiales bacterium]
MINLLDAHFAQPLRALNLRTARSEVLAANIANADTPQYKARDFSFATALKSAGDARFSMALTSERHLSGRSTVSPALQYRIPVQASIDGNTVELDTELAQFSNNAIGFQADLAFMNRKIHGMVAAIQGS